jgi:hypothetical protein
MSEKGSLVVLGNNFDVKCAFNRLLIEQYEGTLSPNWKVKVFKAWKNKPLWKERYPAKNEAELMRMLKPKDMSEWLADFQQEPTPPDGFLFQRLNPIPLWNTIPEDARGVLYCDPNLSKKGKGDSTAIIPLLYSPKYDLYYIPDLVCHSFYDSDMLLNEYLKRRTQYIRYCGFDGNVSQESTWTNNIRHWCRNNKKPFPTVFYKRYKVDELSKNAAMAWNSGKVLLPPWITSTKDGQSFLSQLFSFRGKKANLKDDGPDGFVSAFELLHEMHLGQRTSSNRVSVITDFYNF